MNTDDLLKRLKGRGIECRIEPLDYFTDLTLERSMVHCTLPGKDKSRVYAGFWLHTGSGLGFLGLWSGHLLQVSSPSEIIDLADAVLSDCIRNKRGTPYNLPKAIVDKHRLETCEVVFIWPESEVERLDEVKKLALSSGFSLRTFVDKLTPLIDACEVQPDGFVSVRLGEASALARFRGKEDEKQTSFPVLIHGEFPGTPEQNRLLQTVSEALGCAIYDPGWNNRIHWDDPYYGSGDAEDVPEEPRNAHPVE